MSPTRPTFLIDSLRSSFTRGICIVPLSVVRRPLSVVLAACNGQRTTDNAQSFLKRNIIFLELLLIAVRRFLLLRRLRRGTLLGRTGRRGGAAAIWLPGGG